MKKITGFTLIEALVVMAIMGILAAVAIPTYSQFVREARRSDAKETLLRMAAANERYYVSENRYITEASDISALGGANSTEGYYTIAVSTTEGNTNAFTLTATPATGSPQVADTDCATMTIDHLGRKRASNSADEDNDECWD